MTIEDGKRWAVRFFAMLSCAAFIAFLVLSFQGCTLPQTGVPQVGYEPKTDTSNAVSCCGAAWGLKDGESHQTRSTSYYGADSTLEGGFSDERSQKLQSLQDFLAGKVTSVTVAMDKLTGPYGMKLCSPTLNKDYGASIPLARRDNGGAFKGKMWTRIDINTASKKHSLDSRVNKVIELIRCK